MLSNQQQQQQSSNFLQKFRHKINKIGRDGTSSELLDVDLPAPTFVHQPLNNQSSLLNAYKKQEKAAILNDLNMRPPSMKPDVSPVSKKNQILLDWEMDDSSDEENFVEDHTAKDTDSLKDAENLLWEAMSLLKPASKLSDTNNAAEISHGSKEVSDVERRLSMLDDVASWGTQSEQSIAHANEPEMNQVEETLPFNLPSWENTLPQIETVNLENTVQSPLPPLNQTEVHLSQDLHVVPSETKSRNLMKSDSSLSTYSKTSQVIKKDSFQKKKIDSRKPVKQLSYSERLQKRATSLRDLKSDTKHEALSTLTHEKNIEIVNTCCPVHGIPSQSGPGSGEVSTGTHASVNPAHFHDMLPPSKFQMNQKYRNFPHLIHAESLPAVLPSMAPLHPVHHLSIAQPMVVVPQEMIISHQHRMSDPSNFKTYTLQDFKRQKEQCLPQLRKLGGLGPDLESDDYTTKMQRRIRQKEYAAKLRKEHFFRKQDATSGSSAPNSRPTSATTSVQPVKPFSKNIYVKSEFEIKKEVAQLQRQRMQQYAKQNLPKPVTVKKKASGQKSIPKKHSDSLSSIKSPSVLECLEAEYENRKSSVESIRKKLGISLPDMSVSNLE